MCHCDVGLTTSISIASSAFGLEGVTWALSKPLALTSASCSSSSVNSLNSLSSSPSASDALAVFPFVLPRVLLEELDCCAPFEAVSTPDPFPSHSAGTCCHSSSVSLRRRLTRVPLGSDAGVSAFPFPFARPLTGVSTTVSSLLSRGCPRVDRVDRDVDGVATALAPRLRACTVGVGLP